MITISTRGLPQGLTEKDLRKTLEEVFKATRKTPRGGVSITCVTDEQMASLNKTYRGKSKTTDVLSFHPSELLPVTTEKEWGDIFISPSYVRGEAKRRGIEFKEEMLRVSAHGMLHLMGYDHASESDETKMFTLQERAVARALDV